MKQILIIFFMCLVVIAIIIRGCNDDTLTDEEMTELIQSEVETNESATAHDNKNVPIEDKKQLYDNDSTLLNIVSVRTENAQILNRLSYTASYNPNTRCPNWVAWKLTREHTDGPYSRKHVPYRADDGTVLGIDDVLTENIKEKFILDLESVEPRQQLTDWSTDYNMSHGHMCPAGDNKWDKAAMNQTFLLTNICPQDRNLNNGGWRVLEEKCRYWAKQYGEIYIVTGPIFREESARHLGQIAIPDAFFKVVLCLQNKPIAIGFIYLNDSSSQSFRENFTTVDNIEEITGFDFFSQLEDSIENKIESHCNLNDW